MHRLYVVLALPLILVGAGAVGYRVIEGWPLMDAFYMTIITVSTVGFHEVHELTPGGRVFTMVLIMGGVFTVFYAGVESVRAILGGELRQLLGRQRMERSLEGMKNHLIVCGLGRMGQLVCREFSAARLAFVVIERKEDLVKDFIRPHGVALLGDATSDEVLKKAGVERARCLVTAAASDADNLYITMSARLLNPKLFIVARAEDERAEAKLLRSGANRVISPYVIGGQRVAQAVLRPTVLDFIDLATRSEHFELQIEEIEIRPSSRLSGQVVKNSRIREDLGIIVVAIKKPDGRMVFNPAPDVVMEASDVLITLGPRSQLDRLERMAQP
jgi:voltage-gated potassium channel